MEGSPNGTGALALMKRFDELNVLRMPVHRSAALVIGLSTVFSIGGPAAFAQSTNAVARNPRDLAQQLNNRGVRFYGSWRCPACQYQLELFGLEAKDQVPYIECNKPKRYPEQARLCRKAELRVYPTWERRDGDRLEGVQSLDTLNRWSATD